MPLVLVAALLAGCGSESARQLPPPAQPRASPPLSTTPAGRVVKLGAVQQLVASGAKPAGRNPEGVAVDPGTGVVAVGVRRPAQIVLVDGRTGAIRRRLALPAAARHVAADGHGAFLVPAQRANRLLTVRARDGRVLAQVATGAGPDAVTAVGTGAVVAAEEGGAIDVVPADGPPSRVTVAAQPSGLALADDGRALAVVSARARKLQLFDPLRSYRLIGSAAAGVGPTGAVALGNRVFVVDTRGDALLVFDVRPRLALVRRYELAGGPYGIALDPERRRLWVTLTQTNQLVELPAHGRPHILRTFATVRQPDSVAVDVRTGRVFVGGRADGVLQILSPAPRQ